MLRKEFPFLPLLPSAGGVISNCMTSCNHYLTNPTNSTIACFPALEVEFILGAMYSLPNTWVGNTNVAPLLADLMI